MNGIYLTLKRYSTPPALSLFMAPKKNKDGEKPIMKTESKSISYPVIIFKPSLIPHFLLDSNLFVIPEFFTPQECNDFISVTEAHGFSHQSSRGPLFGEAYRDNYRISVNDPRLAESIWRSGLNSVWENIKIGKRSAKGLNSNLRFYKYTKGQQFGKHYDDNVRIGKGISTEFTMLIYLSGKPSEQNWEYNKNALMGGETVFYSEKEEILNEVVPEVGMVLFHRHGSHCMLHEAKEVINGVKYVLRSDVIFS